MIKKINNNIKILFPRWYKIVFLHAHTDDESFLNGWIIDKLLKLWRDCILLYCAAWLIEGNRETIIRQNEIIEAVRKYLYWIQIVFLKYTDSWLWSSLSLSKNPLQKIIKDIHSNLYCVDQNIKYVFVWYDTRWGYGHKDHKIVHKIGKNLAKKNTNSIYYEITINETKIIQRLSKNKKVLPINQLPKIQYWGNKFGTKESDINYVYILNKRQIDLKKKLLLSHKSQIEVTEFPISLDEIDFKLLFWSEYLRKSNLSSC